MPTRLFLLLSILAVMASGALGQNVPEPTQLAQKLTFGAADDPFGLLESEEDNEDDKKKRAAGVKASVVVNMAAAERSAFSMINSERRLRGLAPLKWSDELAAVGRLHSQNMAEFKFFAHRGLDNKLVSDRADQVGVGNWRSIGENIAFNRGYGDPAAKAFELWLDSASHRRNMLDPQWTESGIGVARAADGSVYFTQVFLVRR